jgi:hypothetical protein
MSGIKRAALVFAVVSLLLFADGAYLQATNNNVGGDTGVLFGNPNHPLSAGTVVLISAGFLLLGAVLLWFLGMRRDRLAGGPARVAGVPVRPVGAQARPAGPQVGAGPGGVRKETGDQR